MVFQPCKKHLIRNFFAALPLNDDDQDDVIDSIPNLEASLILEAKKIHH